jgi:hypothetical protein
VERKFLLLPGCVRVLLERGSAAADIVPVLADAILLAKKKRRDGLLVISGLDEPATAASLSDAIRAMHAAGAPPPSKLAFVALMYPQYAVYHIAEHLAPRYGMQAKVFADVVEAKMWLREKQRPPSSGIGQSSTTPVPDNSIRA